MTRELSHYIVCRVRKDGGSVRIGIGHNGDWCYSLNRADDLLLYDRPSAEAVVRACQHAGLSDFGTLTDEYRIEAV